MFRMASIFVAAGLLAACSTSDVLTLTSTPPAPVGSASPQVAQNPPPVAAAPQTNVARQNLAPPTTTYSDSPAGGGTYQQQAATTHDATPARGRPPSTFGQQAEQLGQPQQAAVASTAAPAAAQTAPQQLAPAAPPATAVQQQAIAAQPAATQPAAAQPAAAQPATTQPSSAPPATAVAAAQTIRFLPIIGAPSEKLAPLSARLGDSVRAAGLTIVPMDQTTADISLKGYFSVVDQDGRVSVVYVWDVIGPDGLRLHRIQGSTPSPDAGFSGSDPWDGVTPAMMADIGQESVGSLLAWLDSQG
ncbi:UNVERIFIED_ORG: hypothetical protein BCL66_11744 [Martelella mediterranea]